MSHADSGPLASYNSLQDKHLAGYFSNTRMKRHLRKSGLVTKKGTIIDEKTYRLNMAKKEHRKHVRDLLATAIVHKTLDIERVRQYEIRKRLDEAYKVELVRRVKTDEVELKEGRNRKGDEDILPLLSPRERTAHMRKVHKGKRERPSTAPATLLDDTAEVDGPLRPSEIYYDDDSKKIYYRVASSSSPVQMDETEELGPSPYVRAYPFTYPTPAPPPTGTPRRSRTASTPRRGIKLQRYHYLARTEPAVARRVQLQSMAEVTMKFLGPSLVLTNSMFPEDRLSEVMVLQQHCGGSTLCVFRELLPPNTIFTFISRRHRGAPFGLTFYIDGMQDIRLSSCCEYKHKPGKILGGRNGHFQFVLVEGAAPCYRCQVASGVKSKHRSSQGDEDGERLKTFLTETGDERDREEDEEGEVFDVIITKIKPPGDENRETGNDGGEMVDNSTQTPREDDVPNNAVEEENKGDQEGEGEEPGADEYDNDDFQESPENEDGENEEKEKSDKENEDANEEYNEDFESDDEKEKEKSDISSDEESDEKSDKDSEVDDESDKRSDKHSDSEADNESDKESIKGSGEDSVSRSDKEADKPESDEYDDEVDEIQDETEEKGKTLLEESGKQEEADEVEDEVDERKEEGDNRPVSAASSEGKQSKNVSFDDDVTVIDTNHPGDELDERDGMEQDEGIPDDSKPGEENEGDEKHKDGKNSDQPVSSPEPSDSSSESSSSSSSSSESSDSDDDEDRESKRKKKTKSRPGEDPGSDPDLVSSGQLPEQALKAVGVTPGKRHEGSVQVLLEGKEDVDIFGVELTTDQFEEVARIIDSKEELGSVTLRNTAADDNTLEILAEPLKRCHDLKMLNLSVNRIGPAGAKLLAAVIRENKSLRMLLLHGNPLTDEGVEMIVDAVLKTSNISLMNLDLGDCSLTVEGAKHVARLIESNNTITILTVSGNSFELEGWKAISNALKANTTLETLSLDFNEIGDEEAVLIAEGLQECKKLRSIDLEGNKIGDEGGRRLFKAVKMNKSIVDLTLFPMNQISKEIMDDVKELLELRAKGIEPEEAEIVEDNTDKLQGDQKIEEKPQDDQNKSEQVIDVKGTIESEQQKGVPAEESRQKGGSETEENQGTENDPPEKISGDASDDAEATKDGSEGLEDENQRDKEVAATDEEETGTSLDEQQPEKEEVKSAKTDGEENNAEQGSLDERGPLKDGEVSRPEEAATAEDPQNKNEREKDTKDDKDTGDVVPPQNEEQNEKPRHDASVEEPSEEIPSEEGSTGRGPSADEVSEQERPVKEETKEKKKLDKVSPGGKVLEDQDEGTVEES